VGWSFRVQTASSPKEEEEENPISSAQLVFYLAIFV
jgi:hypothetical protein